MVGCAPCRLPLIFSACWLEADRFLRLRAHQMARKALEKNTGKTRGRPRKGFRRDGSGIKKSSGVERCTMDAGCRMYNIGLQIASSQHEAARRHACKRQHQYKTLQRSVTTAIQPPKHHSKWIKWLRDSVSSTEDSKTIKIARPIILSRTLFHEGSISTEGEELGRLLDPRVVDVDHQVVRRALPEGRDQHLQLRELPELCRQRGREAVAVQAEGA